MNIDSRYTFFTGFILSVSLIFTGIALSGSTTAVDDEQSNRIHSSAYELDMEPVFQEGQTVSVEDGDTLEVSSFGSDLSYDVTEIRAKAGSQFTIRYINASSMPHNMVFVNTEEDINPVGIAALQAYQNGYIPENEMDRIFAYSDLATPESTVEVTITVPEEPGSYPYICTYPGHFTSMQGRLVVTEE
ncbi:MAG: plastocyanin/azurin family copper-binding protein [Balneolaceae bacterium]